MAHNGGQQSADHGLSGDRLRTSTAMNRGDEARGLHGVSATHAADGQQLTAAKLASTGAENSKKPPDADATKKAWYHYIWW